MVVVVVGGRSMGLGALDLRAQTWHAMLRGQWGKPLLNLDFLLKTVVQDRCPLDWDKFAKAQENTPLKVSQISMRSSCSMLAVPGVALREE